MSGHGPSLKERHKEFIREQKMFFVATAPLSADGHVNVSPKGLDSFAIIDDNTVAYIDFGGSGIETHAHLMENGRLCVMFCAFAGDPLIVRLYGKGEAYQYGTPEFDALRGCFPEVEAPVRGIIKLHVSRVSDSCGWGVPLYEYQGQRTKLVDWVSKSTQDEYWERRLERNAESIDGLPGLVRS